MAQITFGFGILFTLPPFEGLDEVAHYSRVKAEAFYPATPEHLTQDGDYSGKYIDREVSTYYHRGPMPVAWINFPPMHENDPDPKFVTYGDFFQTPGAFNDYSLLYRIAPAKATYQPSKMINWEYQHPGLYYSLMAQVMRVLAGHLSLIATILCLRGCSLALAMAGFGIGLWGTAQHARKMRLAHADKILAFGLLYPFLMPDFFWEFARVGNDSLCLFFFGIAWTMTLWILREPREDGWIYLGLSLALGCLTKVLMLPIAFGIFFFLAFYFFRSPAKQQHVLRLWQQPVLRAMLLFAFIMVPNYVMSGNFGSSEFNQVLHNVGAFELLQKNFSWHAMSIGMREIVYFLIWLSGTHSLIILDLPVHKLIYAFSALACSAYIIAIRRMRIIEALLPVCVIFPVATGLIAHIFVVMIIGTSFTPGYYLHILAPAWALIFGLGLLVGTEKLWPSRFLALWVTAIVMINFIIAGSYLTYFAGCAVPAKLQNLYVLSADSIWSCAVRPNLLFNNLDLIAWPIPGLIAFSIAALALILGFYQFGLTLFKLSAPTAGYIASK